MALQEPPFRHSVSLALNRGDSLLYLMVNQWAHTLLSRITLIIIISFITPPTYKMDTLIISLLQTSVIKALPLTMRLLKSLSIVISGKLHLTLKILSDAVLLSSDNTAELNSATTSNPFAIATAKTTTELSPSFNDTAAVAAQSSSAQLSALSQQMYHVKWNGAMYFVVIFASIMGATLLLWLSQFILKKRLRKKEREPARRRSDIIAFDESKFKGTTKLLEALRGKNISHPTEAGEGGYDPLKE